MVSVSLQWAITYCNRPINKGGCVNCPPYYTNGDTRRYSLGNYLRTNIVREWEIGSLMVGNLSLEKVLPFRGIIDW